MNQFKQILSKYAKKVNKELGKVCDKKIKGGSKVSSTNKFYYQALKEFLLRGGKRLRPVSFIMACKGVDPKVNLDEVIKASLSVEFLHNGTLSHDDVMDEDELRRGGPSSWVIFRNYHNRKWGKGGAERYGESMAIMQGNSFTTLAFDQLMHRKLDLKKKVDAINYLNHYFDVVNNGQVFDISLEKTKKVTEKNYLDMVMMKTGALFEGSIVIGAALGGAGKKQLGKLKEYSIKMGKAFQMQDDVLGTFGSEKKFGKPTDSDIKEGKRTLMVIYALKKANVNDKKFMEKVLGNRQASNRDVNRVRKIMIRTGAVDYSKKKAKKLAEDSKKAVNNIRLNRESKEFFIGLADFVLEREI
jgi:geranylgeranyl diphosphate synthase type I